MAVFPHKRIEQCLLDHLGSPEWGEGDIFLSEGAVAERFSVSRSTAKKALHALRRKGYLDSRQGKGYIVRSPSTRRPTHTLGTVLLMGAHFDHPVVAARMAGLQDALVGTPYAIKTFIQCDSDAPSGRQSTLNMAEEFTPERLDGLNTQVGHLSIDNLRALSRELVLVCNNWFEPDRRWSYVQFDFEAMHLESLRHLVKLGHRHIALLHTIDDMGYWNHGRPDYPRMSKLAAAAAHEGVYLECVRVADHQERFGEEVGELLLTRDNRPTAIIGSDDLTLGLFKTAARLKLAIPRELSLVSVNDLLPAGALPLPLTAMRLDYARLGRTMGEEFLRLLNDPAATGRKVLLPARLEVRASTAPPPDAFAAPRGRALAALEA